MKADCPHHPPCQLTCRVCGKDLPEHKEFPEGTKNVYVVHFENGARDIVQAGSEEEALDMVVILARSAGLCLNHLVRVTGIEKWEGK